MCEMYAEKRLLDAKCNKSPVGYIFALKNFQGDFVDKQEVVNTENKIEVKLEIRNSIKRHKAYIEGQYEDRLLNDARSPIGTLFTLKNNYGWVDKQEVVNTNNNIEVKLED